VKRVLAEKKLEPLVKEAIEKAVKEIDVPSWHK
jgi:hypothetical protein